MTSTSTVGEHNLNEFRELIEQRSGIRFDSSRERFFSTRIREHVQAKGLASPADLMPLLLASNVEYESLLQRMLTHETSFFRYPSAFKALKNRVLPEVYTKKLWAKPRKLRIWSAGCSTGEEPYSIAVTVAESPNFSTGWETEILATDVSRQAIARATQAVYSPRGIANMSAQQVEAFFTPVGGQFQVKPAIRSKVSFVVMNLVQCLYLGRMDCIFCMNVLIYFSNEKREQLIRCFYDCLEPGGYLMLGHSDSLGNMPTKFEKIVFDDFMLYRKPGAEITTSNSRSQA